MPVLPHTRKTFLITGVSRGLGEALAIQLASLGHRIVGCARSTSALDRVARRLGPAHSLSAVDVADSAAIGRWIEQLRVSLPAPDFLVNNAALMNTPALLWDVPLAEVRAVVDVNLLGSINLVRHVVPWMLQRGQGIIVNMSSGWGRSVDRDVVPYCATKWAIEGLSRGLSLELPGDVSCVALNPGIIDTDMLRSCWSEAASSFESPRPWAIRAARFLLELKPRDNGRSLTVPSD